MKKLAVLVLLAFVAPAAAQDIRGMEACLAEKQMERRTGCLQANIEFLQQEIIKLKRDAQTQLNAAKADIAALKAGMAKLEGEMAQLKKHEPAKK
ncbi:MAG: hypothetical protein ABI830_11835 [Pseudolabrys sp.]